MQALIVVDAQNEFSSDGLRAVPNHAQAFSRIEAHIRRVRKNMWPIAWVRHFNKPNESKAFVQGTWGAELSPGLGPKAGFLPKSNGGARCLVQHGWQLCVEGMARNQVDCKTYKSSRCESRPK